MDQSDYLTAQYELRRQQAEKRAAIPEWQRKGMQSAERDQYNAKERSMMNPSQEEKQGAAYTQRHDPYNSAMARGNRERQQQADDFLTKQDGLVMDAEKRKLKMEIDKTGLRKKMFEGANSTNITYNQPGSADRMKKPTASDPFSYGKRTLV